MAGGGLTVNSRRDEPSGSHCAISLALLPFPLATPFPIRGSLTML